MGAQEYSQIKDLNTRANLCKNYFNPATTKNDNVSIVMSKTFV